MHDRDLDGPPVPFTAPRTRTLRCGCRQETTFWPGPEKHWRTYHFCRRHDLLNDAREFWYRASTNEWLKLAVCGLTSAALTYLVFGGS